MCQYALLLYPFEEKSEKNPFFKIFFEINFRIFFVSGKSHSAEKCKRGPLGVFEHPLFCKIGKKLRKKSLTKPKNLHKKFLVMGGTRTHVLLLGRRQKLS